MADGSVIIEIKGDSDGFEKELRNAGDIGKSVFQGLTKFAAGLFTIDKIKDLVVGIYEVGTAFETSFAQVETIMDTSQMSVEEMRDSIRDLSKETGVSAAELSETVYNAISATGDTAHAVDLVADATKLATAGFTDTDSALSVLTTTMNAYHMSAEEAAAISDSLIMTQNLGVTTIDALSGSMGKAIATASAYSVDLHNLESAYISLTKSGISTEESTTYLSSMLKELGDSGSQVGKILQEKTGKSFGTLMEEGQSLGDVMGVLLDSVDGNAEALMNLWGSAEAGKAANAIASQGLEEFNQNLETVRNSAGATQTAYETMADTMEHKVARIKTQAQDMAISLYDAAGPILSGLADFGLAALQGLERVFTRAKEFIEPIMEGIRAAFQKVKDAIDRNFTPEQQAAIGAFFEKLAALLVSAPFAVFAAGVEIVTSAISMLCDVIGAVVNFFTNTLPNAVATVKEKFSSLSGVFETIASAASGAVDVLKSIFEGLKGVVEKVIDFIMSGLDKLLGLLSHLPGEAGQFFADLRAGAEQDAEGFSGVGGKIMDSTEAGASANAGKVSDAVTGAVEKSIGDGKAAAEAGKSIGETEMSSATGGVNSGSGNLTTATTSAVQGAVNAGTAAASGGKGVGTQLIGQVAGGVTGAVSNATNAAKSAVDQAVNQAKTAAGKGREVGAQFDKTTGQGITSNQSTVSGAARGTVTSAVSAAQGASSGASAVGAAIAAGVAAGIRGGAAAAISAAASMARSALAAAKAALGIASPSKEFYEIGTMICQGMANGVLSSAHFAEEAVTIMAGTVKAAVKDLNDEIEEIEAKAAERAAERELADHEKSLRDKHKALEKAETEYEEKRQAKQEELNKAAAKDRQKLQKELTKLEEDWLEDREKTLEDIARLEADWEEKQLQKQEAAQKKALQSRIDALEDLKKEYEKTVDEVEKERDDHLNDLARQQESVYSRLADRDLFRRDQYNNKLKLLDLQPAIDEINRYEEVLTGLKERGIDESLMGEILGMNSKDAVEFGQALLKMGDDQYDAYMAKWAEKEAASKRVAENLYAGEVQAAQEAYGAVLNSLEEEYLAQLPDDLGETGKESMDSFNEALEDGFQRSIQLTQQFRQDIQAELAQIDAAGTLKDQILSESARFSAALAGSSGSGREARSAAQSSDIMQLAGAIGSVVAATTNPEREVVLNVNGKEFARATIGDYRSVEDQSPRIVSDKR